MLAQLPQIQIDRRSRLSLQRQIYEAIRDSVLEGGLRPGMRLPASRALASELGVGRNTVTAAIDQLVAEGYLESRVGSGTRVAESLPDDLLLARAEKSPRQARVPTRGRLSNRGRDLSAIRRFSAGDALAFQPGCPAFDLFPFELWARLLGRRARTPRVGGFGYSYSGGFPPLRQEIASYLGAARGVRCDPEQVIVVAGTQAALDLVARMLLDPGDRVWIEDPGYLGARGALVGAGAELVPVPVDDAGLVVAEGVKRAGDARMAYVTPSHQFPTGATLSLPRRLALLDWAADRGGWIIEDDYDSEYRFEGRPLASLQGLDRAERVVYLGTFSKTLFPALRVGYVVVPVHLVDDFRGAIRHTGHMAAVSIQAALADFLAEGHFASHVRRTRAEYQERAEKICEVLEAELADHLEWERPVGGMQLAARFRSRGMDDRKIAAAAAAKGVTANPLSQYSLSRRVSGLYLGYAAVPPRRMRAPARALAGVLSSGS